MLDELFGKWSLKGAVLAVVHAARARFRDPSQESERPERAAGLGHSNSMNVRGPASERADIDDAAGCR